MQRMSTEPYLPRLTARLADGLATRRTAFRARHAGYLRAAQNPDGGWPGREGGSDLYYTGFALRGLAVLGELTPDVAERAAGFLRGCLAQQATVVDFFSLLYACGLVQLAGGPDVLAGSAEDWPERVAALLERFRSKDGGYTRTPQSAGSTYHTFLVALCYQLLGRDLPDRDAAVAFVLNRRRDDGGFVEFAPMRRGGTNPTAAAVGVLQTAGALTPDLTEGVTEFLAGVQTGEGGFAANGRMPVADLLSTFTAAWTLEQLGARDRFDTAAALRYARQLERPEGSFHGGVWDGGFDVEYTFYGLGAVGLLEAPPG
jgi:geranylgeranyl transferase type-2 subunit beta